MSAMFSGAIAVRLLRAERPPPPRRWCFCMGQRESRKIDSVKYVGRCSAAA